MYQSTHTGAQVDEAVDKALSADAVPTPGSTNLVESGGVYGVVSNRNLLDNGWFTVNQRGLTSYAWNGMQYSIDRWKWDTLAAAPLEVQSDGVNLNASALTVGNPYMRQIIDNPTAYRGKTMTFSAIVSAVSGASSYGFLRVYSGAGTQWGVYIGADTGLWTATFTVPNDATTIVCDIGAYLGRTVKVVAAKLELGSVSTLANDAPPCFAAELAKCQRYCYVIKAPANNLTLCAANALDATNIYAGFAVPPQMRTPTISLSSSSAIKCGTSVFTITPSSVSVYSYAAGIATMLIAATSLTAGTTYRVGLMAGESIIFSADL